MGLLESMLDTGLDPETDKLVTGILGRYGQYQAAQSAGNGLMNYFTGDGDLDHENKRLDIAMKRRTLGLQDSDDFDEARNSDAPLYAIAHEGLQRIPEPGFLSPKMEKAGKSLLEPFFKIARKVPHGSRPGAISSIIRSIAS